MKPFLLYIQLLVLLFSSVAIDAQNHSVERAYELAIAGEHQQAETVLSLYLDDHPNDMEARMIRASNYAWWGKYDQAIKIYDSILRNHPNQTEALEGKGYALAWSGSYNSARNAFIIALDHDPDNHDAHIGIGHTYIMEEKNDKAEMLFDSLLLEHPKYAPYHSWLGIAYFNQYELDLARKEFQRAISLDPEISDATFYLQKLKEVASPVAISLWGGWSQVGNENELGVRSAQMTYQFNHDIFSYVRYDNSLGMDNIDFILSDQDVHALSLGTFFKWHRSLGTRLEYGLRFFPGDITQHQVGLEQVFFLPASHSLRLGGMVGLSEALEEEYLLYAGGHVPLTEQLSLEPTYFFSDNNRNYGRQHRFLLAGKYRSSNGFEIVIGGIYGRAELPADLNVGEEINGMFSHLILPVSNPVRLQFGLQYEHGIFENRLSAIGGINLRLGT